MTPNHLGAFAAARAQTLAVRAPMPACRPLAKVAVALSRKIGFRLTGVARKHENRALSLNFSLLPGKLTAALNGRRPAGPKRAPPRRKARLCDAGERELPRKIHRVFGSWVMMRTVETNTGGPWRKEWDSNPRGGHPPAGFQDQCLRPLGHPSSSALIGTSAGHVQHRSGRWRAAGGAKGLTRTSRGAYPRPRRGGRVVEGAPLLRE